MCGGVFRCDMNYYIIKCNVPFFITSAVYNLLYYLPIRIIADTVQYTNCQHDIYNVVYGARTTPWGNDVVILLSHET